MDLFGEGASMGMQHDQGERCGGPMVSLSIGSSRLFGDGVPKR